MKELETKYNHESVEKDKYDIWLKNGYFKVILSQIIKVVNHIIV